jgi:hypothetical protein
MATEQTKKIIGRAEHVAFPELGFIDVPARIDTGAKTSAIWADKVTLIDGALSAVLFGPASPHFDGSSVTFKEFDTTAVSTSTGEVQERYKVRLQVKLKGKKIRAWFTLADRSSQVYPVLIGRNVLLGKFVVDVKKGQVLKEEEERRTQSLRANLDKPTKEQS